MEADRALLEAQLAHANAHIDGVERQLSGMRRQLAGLLADDGSVHGEAAGSGSPQDRAQQGAMVVCPSGSSSGSARQGSDVSAQPHLIAGCVSSADLSPRNVVHVPLIAMGQVECKPFPLCEVICTLSVLWHASASVVHGTHKDTCER